jgi:hypothetical protein
MVPYHHLYHPCLVEDQYLI